MIINLDCVGSYDTIIFEGCDGAGKTTLAEATADRINARLIHSALTPPDTDLYTLYLEILDSPGRLVLDRSFLSEQVYGPLYRQRSRLTDDQLQALIHRTVDRHGVSVHVTARPSELRRRLAARGETSPPVHAELQRITDRYTELFSTVRLMAPVHEINTGPSEQTQ